MNDEKCGSRHDLLEAVFQHRPKRAEENHGGKSHTRGSSAAFLNDAQYQRNTATSQQRLCGLRNCKRNLTTESDHGDKGNSISSLECLLTAHTLLDKQ
jgi:hypothetical protein